MQVEHLEAARSLIRHVQELAVPQRRQEHVVGAVGLHHPREILIERHLAMPARQLATSEVLEEALRALHAMHPPLGAV